MATTKKSKDLPAQKDVKGGSPAKLAANDSVTIVRAAKPKKDLVARASKPVKGGGRHLNDNLTLVRAATPTKKDLPAAADIKAGGKRLNDNLTLVRIA